MAYDGKGYWRNDGDGFYDAKGYWRNPGDGFYDGKGYWRNPDDGFYDAKGYWRSSGDGYYDGKGVFHMSSANASLSYKGAGIFSIWVILFVPIGLIWLLTMQATNWLFMHFYLVYTLLLIIFVGYSCLTAILRKYHGISFIMSLIGNFLCLMSLTYVMFIYAVPYFISKGNFWGFFELILSFGLTIAGVGIIQFWGYYFKKAFIEFILGIGFFILIYVILGTDPGISLKGFMDLYNLQNEGIVQIVSGFILK